MSLIMRWWISVMALAVMVPLASCVVFPSNKRFSCPRDGGPCEQEDRTTGDRYVCYEGFCVPPSEVPRDGGVDGGIDGGVDAGLDAGDGIIIGTPLCTDAGWCWENPVAGDQELLAVRGSRPDEFWAVGQGGTALHWNGTHWSRVETGRREALHAVWLAPDGTVWAAGTSGAMLHYVPTADGGTWRPYDADHSATLYAIDGDEDAGVFAVGQAGLVLAYRDGGWVRDLTVPDAGDPPADWYGTSVGQSGDVWIVGQNGWRLHRDPTGNWGATGPTPPTLRAVHGQLTDNAWAVGEQGTAQFWNGVNWVYRTVDGGPSLTGVWSYERLFCWAVGSVPGTIYNLDPSKATPMPTGSSQTFNAVWGIALDDLWAVGTRGSIVRNTGTTWSEYSGGATRTVNGMWRSADGQLSVVGDEFLATRDNSTGTWIFQPNAANARTGVLNAVAVTPEGLTAVGKDGGVYLRDLDAWTPQVVAYSANDSPQDLHGLHSSSGGTWAVGDQGLVLMYDSQTRGWLPRSFTGAVVPDLRGVWVSPSGTVWVVGMGGSAYRRDGSSQSWGPIDTVAPPGQPPIDFNAVWGSGEQNVWVVGAGGSALHNDGGTTLALSARVTSVDLRAVHGTGPNDVWAVGDDGTILWWNGSYWIVRDSGTHVSFRAVWVTPTDVWVAGADGAILRYVR